MSSKQLECAYLFFLFTLLLYSSAGVFWGHRASHDYPYGYLASDPFHHQTRIEGIKELGHYRTQASYTVAGYTDVVGFYPPILLHLAVLFSDASGLEVYDSVYLLVFLFMAVSPLVMYLALSRFSRPVAALASSLSVFLFHKQIFVPITWGHWPALFGGFLVVSIIWALVNIELKNSYILLAFLFTGVALGHTSEAIFVAVAIVAWIVLDFIINKKLRKPAAVAIAKAGFLSLVFSFYYLMIFRALWIPAESYKLFNYFSPEQWGTPVFSLLDFGWFLPFIILGVVVSLFYLKKENSVITIISLSLLALGFGNYVGMRFRAFQLRFFWPVYLSFFFGIGCFFLIKLVLKKRAYLASVIVAILVAILISSSLAISDTPGMMLQQHWEGFKWISENTSKNAEILYIYGYGYDQNAILRNSKRKHYYIQLHRIAEILQSGKLSRSIQIRIPYDGGSGLAYRTGLFSYALHEDDPGFVEEGLRDVCGFDYYVLDTQPLYQQAAPFVQFGLAMRNVLLKHRITEVYSNGLVSILKNNAKGDECVA